VRLSRCASAPCSPSPSCSSGCSACVRPARVAAPRSVHRRRRSRRRRLCFGAGLPRLRQLNPHGASAQTARRRIARCSTAAEESRWRPWQADFHVVLPAQGLPGGYREALGQLLQPAKSWHPQLEVWGTDEGDRIDVLSSGMVLSKYSRASTFGRGIRTSTSDSSHS
jgi:hypothetical protein